MRAWQAGIRRQRVELLLPLIGATDLDDWPGGIRQQFKAVLPMCVLNHAHAAFPNATRSNLETAHAVYEFSTECEASAASPLVSFSSCRCFLVRRACKSVCQNPRPLQLTQQM